MKKPPVHREDGRDESFMRIALAAAARAASRGEVPIGAVVVHGERVLSRAHNEPIAQCDPSAHAEIVALRKAARKLGNYRLPDCTLYVTVEPCPMCAGAIVQARLARLVYGARDPKAGACGSVIDIPGNSRLNHHTVVVGGVLQAECAAMLQTFFRSRRWSPQS